MCELKPSTRSLWLKSLAAAFIGGGATAAGNWLGSAAQQQMGQPVSLPSFEALGLSFLFGGLVAVAAYLVKSPLPGVDR